MKLRIGTTCFPDASTRRPSLISSFSSKKSERKCIGWRVIGETILVRCADFIVVYPFLRPPPPNEKKRLVACDAVAYQPWTTQPPNPSEFPDTRLGNHPPAVVSRIASPHLCPRSGLYEGAAVRPAAIVGLRSPSP